MYFYVLLKQIHNKVGMFLLGILLLAILIVLIRKLLKKPFGKTSRIASLSGLVVTHIQVLIGLILYFLSPVGFQNLNGAAMHNSISRFYALEHPLAMIFAVTLITIGNHASKSKTLSDKGKYNRVLIYFVVGFVIIIKMIPWFLWE